MGTSTSYSAPSSWGPLKATVTRVAGSASGSSAASGIVKEFIDRAGGARAISRGSGSVVGGGPALSVAGRLGAFVASVAENGLETALREAGWKDLIGCSAQELLACLLDRLGGPASTIDEVDARAALAEFQQRYLDDAANAAEVEERLRDRVENLDLLLQEFFGLYLYHAFVRVFFERLVQRVGEAKANSFIKDIRDYIAATLKHRLPDRDILNIDWAGSEGSVLVQDVLHSTLRVFEE